MKWVNNSADNRHSCLHVSQNSAVPDCVGLEVDQNDSIHGGARSSQISPAVSTVEWNCSMTVRFITHCLLFNVLEIGQALGLKKVSPQAVV